MDKIEQYRQLIKQALIPHSQIKPAYGDIEKQEISMEKAAFVAGLNRRDFLAALAHEKVDVFSVDFDDLERELYHVR